MYLHPVPPDVIPGITLGLPLPVNDVWVPMGITLVTEGLSVAPPMVGPPIMGVRVPVQLRVLQQLSLGSGIKVQDDGTSEKI